MRLRRFELGLSLDVLVCDGAMGTMLMESGEMSGLSPEEMNLTAPDVVKHIHRLYVEAGADIVVTNSFGANRAKLSKAGLGDKVVELNEQAARIAREAVGDGIIVAGDIGPLGAFLEPLGDITYESAVEIFAEQARALAEGGADVFIAETFADLTEAKAAIEGAKKAADLKVICTMTFDTNLHTMMGVSPAEAAKALKEYEADLIGSNCGNGPAEMEQVIRQMNDAAPEVFLVAQPNAGAPEYVNGRTVYTASVTEMADYAVRYKELGCKIIGSCCGSTPDHTRAIAKAVKARR